MLSFQAHRRRKPHGILKLKIRHNEKKCTPCSIQCYCKGACYDCRQTDQPRKVLALTTVELSELAGRHNSPKCTPIVGSRQSRNKWPGGNPLTLASRVQPHDFVQVLADNKIIFSSAKTSRSLCAIFIKAPAVNGLMDNPLRGTTPLKASSVGERS